MEEWTCKPLTAGDREELYATYLSEWPADPQILRSDLEATKPLLGVHRLVSWLRLVPYADAVELRSRAAIPKGYLASVIG
ncbi:hypothetical protein AB0E69_02595 [Kribbella sp. NPDC026611]|uniref:hypothetical protein n=1 Tax=Kribbella sp. NPDC026611 TaxID=3154911 RepID=UPI0033E30EEE